MVEDYDIQGRTLEARAQGYSWDEIGQHLNDKREEALREGYSGGDIDKYLGFKGTSNLEERLRAHALAAVSAEKNKGATGLGESFMSGLQSSSMGLALRAELPEQEMSPDAGILARASSGAGQIIGDIPAMVAGGAGGSVVGGRLRAVVGGMALPAFLRSEYRDALEGGEIKGSRDFAERQAVVAWEVAKAGVVGAATFGAGRLAGGLLGPFGRLPAGGPADRFFGFTAARIVNMTATATALQGH